MDLPDSLTIPHWRHALRHALPNVIEGKLLPAALFIGLLEVWGTRTAVLGALAFALAAMVGRVVRSKTIPGILWLTTLGLLARTIAALATGSVIIYFLQPTIATALVGLAFLSRCHFASPSSNGWRSTSARSMTRLATIRSFSGSSAMCRCGGRLPAWSTSASPCGCC